MARRLLSTEAVLEELELDDDFDVDEPMMAGSDDEFDDIEDVYLEDVEDDDDNNSAAPPLLPPSNTPSSRSDSPPCWSSTLTPVTVPPFSSPVGPTVDIPESPIDTFDLMFTPDLVDDMVVQSNLYAKEVMGEEKYSSWSKITREELRAYLGFCILMGINHLPALDDYWSTDPALHYSAIADRITRDRFREITRYLHFADNTTLTPRGSPGYDRLGKVRPVIDHLSSRFADLYNPHQEVAVDEAMIKFTGRSTLKQYMPLKPVKRGIKVWALADSHNGYFHKFQVYTGKEGSGEKHLGQRVVKDLTQHLKGKHHHVFFDNFFTSEELLRDLAEEDIYACGTARKDRRGFPPALKTAKLKNRSAHSKCTWCECTCMCV